MGVKVTAAGSPLEVGLSPLETVEAPAGKVEGSAGYAYLISPTVNNSYAAVNRILEERGTVQRSRDSFSAGGKSYPPGTFVVPIRGVSRSFMDSTAENLYLTIGTTGGKPSTETMDIKPPKVALYQSYTASSDEGWTRWIFERYDFPYTTIHDADIRAGELGKRFDVLVIPDMSRDAIVNGHKKGTIRPQYVGGITEGGVRNIREFVEQGGTLVTLNSSSLFAIEELDLPVRDALKGLRPPSRREPQKEGAKPPEFACPGSILRMEFDPKHPVSYGMSEKAPAQFSNSPAFTVSASFNGDKAPVTIAKYPKGDILMSGYLRGEKHLSNKASAVDVSVGEGRVILLGFAVQRRGQPFGTFKLLFNSLYYGSSQ